jgi:hypothetical protein
MTKLSQKQRKKLAAEQQIGSPEMSAFESGQSAPAWGNFSRNDPSANGNLSFLDIMKQEMQLMKAPHGSSPMQKQHQQSASPGPGCNPWLRGAEDSRKSPQQSCESSSVVSFMDIVADEKKQRENWSRMRAKPLQLTQVYPSLFNNL